MAQSSLLGNLCFGSVVLCVNITLVFRQYSWCPGSNILMFQIMFRCFKMSKSSFFPAFLGLLSFPTIFLRSWMIIGCYASNLFCLIASIIVCVNGISEVLGPNWIRVSCLTRSMCKQKLQDQRISSESAIDKCILLLYVIYV